MIGEPVDEKIKYILAGLFAFVDVGLKQQAYFLEKTLVILFLLRGNPWLNSLLSHQFFFFIKVIASIVDQFCQQLFDILGFDMIMGEQFTKGVDQVDQVLMLLVNFG